MRRHTGPLPQTFRDRGWRQWGEDGAARLDRQGAPPSALVHRANGWHGYVEFGCRYLRDRAPTMLDAIAQLEWAEAAGFFSPAWRGARALPTRPGWEHDVIDGRDCWEAVIQKPGWWSLRVELLRAAVIVPVVSTVRGATSRDLCASYGLHDARSNPVGLPDMIQHAMRVAEKAADYCARQYGIPEVRLVRKPAAVRAEPPATAVAAAIDEFARV